MPIFAFTQRPEFRTLLEVQFKDLMGIVPVFKDSVEDFRSFLDLFSEIRIVIIDPPQGLENELYSIISAKRGDIKNTFVLADKGQYEGFTYFGQNGIEELFAKVKSIVAPGATNTEKFISIPIDSFIHFKVLPFDLFIKLSEGKYVKRIRANEEIEGPLIKELHKKGVKELWFERIYNKEFSVLLLNNMINKVETAYSTRAEKIRATGEVFATTREIVQSVGLPSRIIQVCETVMDSITADVAKGKFSNYLNSMKSQELTFQYRLVELTSFIATLMVESLGDSSSKVKTIVFCSFFCDIALTEPSHFELRTEESVKDLWHEDKDHVLNHAFKAAELVAKYKNAPPDADLIVRQHHGDVNGKGFPKVCSDKVVPLAKCLMASQELAFALLKNPDKNPSYVVSEVVSAHEGDPLHPFLIYFEKNSREQL
jgi:hypothetical protein